MSQLTRHIVFFIAAFVLPMQGWTAALGADGTMSVKTDVPAHCSENSHHSPHDQVQTSSTDTPSMNQCLDADCHCSALYHPVIPFVLIAPAQFADSEFISTENHFVAITHPPLWRPPITG